jgi:hypothetical protein
MEFKSDWGSTPQEVKEYIQTSLEREVEWPISDALQGDALANALYHIRCIRAIINRTVLTQGA